jgi:predicted kinase
MLIAMAGLPGTGKSTIAARLAEELGAARNSQISILKISVWIASGAQAA